MGGNDRCCLKATGHPAVDKYFPSVSLNSVHPHVRSHDYLECQISDLVIGSRHANVSHTCHAPNTEN